MNELTIIYSMVNALIAKAVGDKTITVYDCTTTKSLSYELVYHSDEAGDKWIALTCDIFDTIVAIYDDLDIVISFKLRTIFEDNLEYISKEEYTQKYNEMMIEKLTKRIR